MISQSDHEKWLAHPVGKIPKGTYCSHCARFNSRDMAVNAIILDGSKRF
jgi:hypothetical protein